MVSAKSRGARNKALNKVFAVYLELNAELGQVFHGIWTYHSNNVRECGRDGRLFSCVQKLFESLCVVPWNRHSECQLNAKDAEELVTLWFDVGADVLAWETEQALQWTTPMEVAQRLEEFVIEMGLAVRCAQRAFAAQSFADVAAKDIPVEALALLTDLVDDEDWLGAFKVVVCPEDAPAGERIEASRRELEAMLDVLTRKQSVRVPKNLAAPVPLCGSLAVLAHVSFPGVLDACVKQLRALPENLRRSRQLPWAQSAAELVERDPARAPDLFDSLARKAVARRKALSSAQALASKERSKEPQTLATASQVFGQSPDPQQPQNWQEDTVVNMLFTPLLDYEDDVEAAVEEMCQCDTGNKRQKLATASQVFGQSPEHA
jgi:hypothetical protein